MITIITLKVLLSCVTRIISFYVTLFEYMSFALKWILSKWQSGLTAVHDFDNVGSQIWLFTSYCGIICSKPASSNFGNKFSLIVCLSTFYPLWFYQQILYHFIEKPFNESKNVLSYSKQGWQTLACKYIKWAMR